AELISCFSQPPLVQAIFNGDPDEIRVLICKSEDVNALDAEKRAPLHAAAFLGDAEIIELLIVSGSRVNAKDNMWLTPLHRAVASRSEDAVRVLIRHSADVNARDKNWQTPLHVAAANKALRCAEVIIPLLSSVNVSDRGGRTALHHAALNGHTEMVSLLLAKGANINAFDKKDCRALHWAAYMGEEMKLLTVTLAVEVPRMQIDTYREGCMGSWEKHLIDEANAFGNTALHVACFNGQDAVVSELIDYGANVSQPNNKGFTPLHFAAASTHGALCLEFLVNSGADVNPSSSDGSSWTIHTLPDTHPKRVQVCVSDTGGEIDCVDKDGNTPLHVAARYGHELLINTLITSGADCTRRGVHGMFPLHLAALNAHADCCRKLLSSGFQIDTPDNLGRTCLHVAAAGGNVECVTLLLSSGADHNRRDKHGRTPLHYAAASQHFQCLETLVSCGTCINATDQWGRSAVHYAAASDLDRRCLEFLLQHGAAPSLKDKQGYSAVHYAAAYGHRHCLKLVRTQICPVSASGHFLHLQTRSPLHLAAYHGQAQALEVLLEGHCEVDQGDEVGRTPLALAALRGHTDCALTLLNHGASPRSKDTLRGRTPIHLAGITSVCGGNYTVVHFYAVFNTLLTPLMLAVMGGHVDAVSLLLEREASVDLADHQGLTALHLGLLCGQEECVQSLLELEASVLLGDSKGRTAIHLAAARGHASWLSELLSIACSEPPIPPFRDNQGYTPLHWACYYGHEGCVEVLLEQRDLRHFDGNPFTPLHCAVTPLHAAAFAGNVDCVQLLLAHNASVDEVDQSGRSALIMAAEKGRVEVVEALLTVANVNLNLTDQKGNTALHLACSNRMEECALLILGKLPDSALIATNAALQTPLHLAAHSGMKQTVQELLSRGASVQVLDENGLTPALACAPSREVADCLALILATMMPFCSPCSSGAPSPGALLKSLPHQAKSPQGPHSPRDPSRPSSEGTTTENDSDSETF
uniref:Ankyrin repeat domain 44 n=1 Tax=Sinocyclocheilus grahami TaxID=75366 RepID=A0A672SWD4_SINGR